ncbi:FliM/FliN family flagellar motor switch protein [Novosphingobium clariflavum]|uniref:FliM/FliN family flagellar motor switch protein n=1 Tax=Novosphingobium clariflavum TaxID=2029884 RepID=A0ABV6S277_9SPHN|nr:FliM/FliN family flagellar motor switch protein [Novosphingobium clariflavum]
MASSAITGMSDAYRKAAHCTELLGKPPSLSELVPALSLVGERLSRTLAAALAGLAGGDPPVVSAGMPMDGTLASLQGDLEGLAAHTLMVLEPGGLPVLATFEAETVFRLVDRTFGGRGALPDPIPEAFPLSALLLIDQIETCLGQALGAALEGPAPYLARSLRRDTSLRQLDPFPRGEELLMLTLEVEEPGFSPWSLRLSFPVATLAAVTMPPRRPAARKSRSHGRVPARPDARREPFASIPVEVTALLVDMTMPMARLSALSPGDVLPVAVARSVPLQLGGRTFATGAVGELDDRVAVQIQIAF